MVPLSLLRLWGTAALHDRLFAANRCPCNGGRPSKPTCVFSSAAQGPVTETLCTRLAPPGGSLYAEEIRFFPVNAFVLFSKWTKFSMIRRQCQAVWLILKMKQFHERRGRIFQNCARGTNVNKLISFWKVVLEPLLQARRLCYTTCIKN